MLVKDQAALDAQEVLDAYWANGFPVDPVRIAEAMGMTVHAADLADNISGMLRVEVDEAPEIFTHIDDVPQRRAFTVAHELGHYYERTQRGDRDFNFIDRRGGTYDVHEFYADEFAGNLLMPADEVRRALGQGMRLARLAQHFGVSLPAMKLRLRRLGLDG